MTRVLAFDTETTGLIKNTRIPLNLQPKVIEFYGVVFDDQTGEDIAELEFICDPQLQLEEIITKITGLTNRDVDGKPLFKEFIPQLQNLFGKAEEAVAHNISYDRNMIAFEMRRADMSLEWPRRLICTVQETIGLKGHRLNLSALHEHLFGERFEGAHRAREDVHALKRCFMKLRSEGMI